MKPVKTLHLDEYCAPDGPRALVLSSRHAGTDRHSHDYYELVYIEEGTGLHDQNGQMNLAMAGDVLILRPGATHRYIGESAMRLYNCMFAPEALCPAGDCTVEEILSRLFPMDGRYSQAHLELAEQQRVQDRLRRILSAQEQRPYGWRTLVQGELTLLCLDCAQIFDRYAPEGGEPNRYVGYATAAMRYIDAHFSEPLTVADVASHVGLSPDYLTRQFRLVTGVAPVSYLRRYRLAHAIALLGAGESVTDAASRVGFQSLAHFSREFKQELGVSPSQYRKARLAAALAAPARNGK